MPGQLEQVNREDIRQSIDSMRSLAKIIGVALILLTALLVIAIIAGILHI